MSVRTNNEERREKILSLLSVFCFINLLSLTVIFSSFGNESGHHGSVKDLLAPSVNFFILMGFIIYKLKDSLKDYFLNYSESIQMTCERAAAKSKEANLKYEMFEKKIKNSEVECDLISKNIDNEIVNFAKNYQLEMKNKAERLKAEALQRFEKEKVESLKNLNQEFLDSIINKASTDINSNNETQGQVTKKILKAFKV